MLSLIKLAKGWHSVLFCLLTIGLGITPKELVYAQTIFESGLKSQADEGSRIVYGEDYFREFNALTAEDLLFRIPGIQDILREALEQSPTTARARRGFGSTGDQILVDGNRLSGKSNTIGSALRRIQASQVQHIEVIRGIAANLDVRTEGIVVNVTLKDDPSVETGTWEGSVKHYSDGDVKPGAQLSYNGKGEHTQYTVGISATPRKSFLDRFDLLFLPGAPPFLREDEQQTTNATDLVGTLTLQYAFANGNRININGRYANEGQIETIESLQFPRTETGEVFSGTLFNLRDVAKTNWEVGIDYEHLFVSGNTFKALLLHNDISENDKRTFSIIPISGPGFTTRLQQQAPDRKETIFRGAYRTALTNEHTIEVGAEAAINKLDQLVQLFVLNNGISTEVPLFNPDSIVDEKRAETFLTLTWQPKPVLQIEGALDTEYSRLRQRGSIVKQTRSFFFLRPRFDIRFDFTDLFQIRGRIERTISQLDFANFVSGFNTDDNTNDVVRAGNPNLVPEKAWEYDLTLERRLRDDKGVWALRLYHLDIEDHIDKIPIAGGLLGATGNIGPAHEYGAELSTGLRLGWLGLPGGSIDASYTARKTSAIDAFTGLRRRLDRRADRFWTLSFRNDTSWNNLSYGLSTDGFGGNNISTSVFFFDTEFEDRIKRRPDLNGFVEVRILRDMLLRLDITRIFKSGASRDRLLFAGNRSTGILRQEEFRKGTFSREIKLSLRSSF